VGPLVGIFFSSTAVTDYSSARRSVENGLYSRFFSAMLERGVAFAPGPYEVMFPGLAHSERHLEEVVSVASQVAETLPR
jgi:glutamate-1-semialdehyde 2,1-aminomutase